MNHIHRGSELSAGEIRELRSIVARSFASAGSVPKLHRERLLALGLISAGMGGLMPTPAGRIALRMIQ
jgi:hypothetical protein